jgi:tetratricopeptide (TPR) repeat protein
VTNRFATNYGIHANLGTAYHLLGRYAEAEREIARDLEIDPNAHFGLEKYHLALLQYLIRDEDYRWRHVYVDEFTHSFLSEFVYSATRYYEDEITNQIANPNALKQEFEDAKSMLTKTNFQSAWHEVGNKVEKIAASDARPDYRKKWNLADDGHLEKGVIYMAGLNENEPACWVMLGMIATHTSDKNLAIAAFEKAIQLGSPQQPILQGRVDALRQHIHEARSQSSEMKSGLIIIAVSLVAGWFLVRALLRGVLRFLFGVRPQSPKAGARQ